MTTPTAVDNPPARRSFLVSFFAWLSILGGVFGVLGTAPVVFAQPSIATMVILIDAVCFFIAGLGLRARREWARRAFVFVLGYSAAMGLIGALRFWITGVFPGQPGSSAPPLTPQQMEAFVAQMRPLFLGMACAGALFSGLLIAWLRTQRIRDEFNPEMVDEV